LLGTRRQRESFQIGKERERVSKKKAGTGKTRVSKSKTKRASLPNLSVKTTSGVRGGSKNAPVHGGWDTLANKKYWAGDRSSAETGVRPDSGVLIREDVAKTA
jgi:hypothetical protein